MLRYVCSAICAVITLGLPTAIQAQVDVTVVLADEAGNTIVPFSGVNIPTMTNYVGRPGFDARTGGAFADQDMREFTATYDGGAVVDTFPISGAPAWLEVHNQSYTPAVTTDGWLRVAEDGTGSQQNNVSWDAQHNGAWTTAQLNFDIRISEGDPLANDKADGFGFKWINSGPHGNSGAFYTAGEEPNLADSLGIGFDIWDNGAATNDIGASGASANTSISLHHGSWIQTVNLMDSANEPSLSADFPLETGQAINVTVIMNYIPEPSTFSLVGLAGAVVFGWLRRRRA